MVEEIITFVGADAELAVSNALPNPLLPFISGDLPVPQGFIVPGQPLNVTWQYWSYHGRSPVGALVTINIYAAQPGSPGFSSSKVFSSGSVAYTAGGLSGQTVLKVDPVVSQPTDTAVKSLYEAFSGMKVLYMEVLDENGRPITSGIYYFMVQLERVADWTDWDVHETMQRGRHLAFPWNENYEIAARFTNKSQGRLIFNGQASLQEAEVTVAMPLVYSAISAISISNLAQTESIQLDFMPIKKTWQWLIPWIWVIDGDTEKVFQYQISYNLTDQYGNIYSDLSDPRTVFVSVSDRKLAYQSTAESLETLSLTLAALSWLITPAPSAIAGGSATAFGAAAKDPPVPSKNYKKILTLPVGSAKPARRPELDSLTQFIALARGFGDSSLSLYEIEARVLGAIAAKNKRMVRLQKRSYARSVQELNVVAEQAYALAKKAVDAIKGWPEVDPTRTPAQVLAWRYKPGTLSKLPLNRRLLKTLKAASSNDIISRLAAHGVESAIQIAGERIVRAARIVTADQFRVLNLTTVKNARFR